MNNLFEYIVQNDPTLKFLLREAEFDTENFDHQLDIKCSAILIAINKWLYSNPNWK